MFIQRNRYFWWGVMRDYFENIAQILFFSLFVIILSCDEKNFSTFLIEETNDLNCLKSRLEE